MNLRFLKNSIRDNLINFLGWRTDRKIIVIESDDWGSIRMPSKKIYYKLKKTRIDHTLSLYDSLDSLERFDDFTHLLELGSQFKDHKNNPIVFTLNTVLQNPDFEKIKESKYNKFYGVPFFKSYQQYYGEDLKKLWFKGIEENIIKPQFHAREHLNQYLWLKDLKNGNKDVITAFDHDFFAVKTKTSSSLRNHYLATYFSETKEEFESVCLVTREGLKMFKNVFGYNSDTFIASNYCWPKELEEILNENRVKGIQTQQGNIYTDYKNGRTVVKRFYTGQKNKFNQSFTVRNVMFEPYLDPRKDWVDSSLKQIKNAFFWKKPAIICMHRINFASEMDTKNRDRNLKALKKLIGEIIKRFPCVEFMSSDQLSKLIKNEKTSHP